MGGLLGMLYRQLTFKPKPLPDSVRLDGKTAIVTGGNAGLGFEAAKELAAHGLSRLVIASRSIAKGEEAAAEIRAASPGVAVEVWALDQEDFASMHTFGRRAAQELTRLDIVILNAGVKNLKFTRSRTGHESNLQINHLGPALLSLLLMGPLKATAAATGQPSRLTIVSSENHFLTKFEEQDAPNTLARMDEEDSFKTSAATEMDRYNASKLLEVLWVTELSPRAGSGSVVVNTVNPGFCVSGLHRGHGEGVFVSLMGFFAWTQAQGGHCLTNAATDHAGSPGAYLSDQKVTEPSDFVRSAKGQKVARKIWDETLQILQAALPGVDLLANVRGPVA